ncbi:MAG TPA: MFS transporter [Bordetella sp.]
MNAKSAPSPAMLRKVLISSVLGNAFEWFDFAIYGMFAVVIAKLFFPTGDATASLMLTLATFGMGFVVRPIGGVLLGLYGDRVGRKKALTLTIVLMAIGTGLIGILPTYAAIGVAAPVLIVLARMLQGLSAGGEFSSATTMLIEFAPRHRRGLYGSLQMCSQALAFSLGAAVAYLITSSLTPEHLMSWGWRLPFLVGILVGPVGWLIRSRVDESPEFASYLDQAEHNKKARPRAPLAEVFRDYPRAMFASIGVCVTGTVSAYVFVFFVPLFSRQQFGISLADANLATFAGTLTILIFCPLAGWLSDKVGRKAVLVPAIVGYAIVGLFCFRYLVASPSFQSLLLLQVCVSFFMSFFWGPTPVVMTEIFPVDIRATGSAFTYNLSVLLFGGLAPFINTWLVQATGSKFAPLYYVLFSALLGVVGALLLPGRQAAAQARPAQSPA